MVVSLPGLHSETSKHKHKVINTRTDTRLNLNFIKLQPVIELQDKDIDYSNCVVALSTMCLIKYLLSILFIYSGEESHCPRDR